jgi:hypothetical protein
MKERQSEECGKMPPPHPQKGGGGQAVETEEEEEWSGVEWTSFNFPFSS